MSKVRWLLPVLNYQLFLDDTGKPELELCGAAGYLATEQEWAAFLPTWEAALPEDMRDGGFSFAELVRQIGVGRNPNDAIALVDVLRTHMSEGFNCLFYMPAWGQLEERHQALFKHPYSLCVVMLLDQVLGHLNHFVGMHEAEQLVTVAEYMDPYDPASPPAPGDKPRHKRALERRTAALWDCWRELRKVEDRVRRLDFDYRKRSPQLQAADLYAHASYRVASRPHFPVRFRGLPDVSSSPPFPPRFYETMRVFLRSPTPRQTWSTITENDVKRLTPFFDAVLDQLPGGSDDPLATYLGIDPDTDG